MQEPGFYQANFYEKMIKLQEADLVKNRTVP